MHARSPDVDAIGELTDRLVGPLDRVRTALLRQFGRPLRGLLVAPESRVAWIGSLGLAVSLALACSVPGLLLLLGPLLLGVPHLLADLRYLVVRPGLHRRAPVVVFALLPCALALVFPVLPIVGVALVGAALAARGPAMRRVVLAVLGVLVIGVGFVTDRRGAIVFAHAHNAIAFAWLGLGLAKTSAARWRLLIPVAVFVAFCALVASGVVGPSIGPDDGVGSEAWLLRTSLSPVDDALIGTRFVTLFAFAQSAHYAIWLRLVPEVARGRRAPRSFRSSARALRAELGTPLFVVGAIIALAFPLAALQDAAFAQTTYLRLALFHGPLELAVAGLVFVESKSAWIR